MVCKANSANSMTTSRNLSDEEQREFWAQLFAFVIRYEQGRDAAQRSDREATAPESESYE